MTDNTKESVFMTSTEVCKYCQFSMSVLNKLEAEGSLKPKRKLPINHRRLYEKEDVDRFLEGTITKQD